MPLLYVLGALVSLTILGLVVADAAGTLEAGGPVLWALQGAWAAAVVAMLAVGSRRD